MAKAGIHPKQHNMVIQLSDGTKIDIVTSYGTEGEVYKLDVDPTNHPAWQEGNKTLINNSNERIESFNKKFGGFDFGFKKPNETTTN